MNAVLPELARPLADKVVWVTGAGRGIGRALSVGLAGAGARLAVTARSKADLSALADELTGQQVLVLPGSVADSDAVSAIVQDVVAEFGRLDVLVNVAGICPIVCPTETLGDADWREIIEVNLSGTFYCCREAGRRMLRAGGGSIINISSVHGSTGVAQMAAYGASKGGVENLTRSLAVEWAPQGVRVNCIAPGYFHTRLTGRYLASPAGDRVRASIPLGRVGDADELVGAAVFLASDASSYVTGTALHVDGGWLAQ